MRGPSACPREVVTGSPTRTCAKSPSPGPMVRVLRLLPPPVRRRDEGSVPDAAARRLRLGLLGRVGPAEARRDRKTLPHHPGVEVAAVAKRAQRDRPSVAVGGPRLAAHHLAVD